MKELTHPQTGKLGNTVSLRTRHGQIRRVLSIPRNRRSAAQRRIRANLGRFAALWRTLTDPQRAAWTRAARDARTRRCLGHATYLTGCQLFIKLNSARAAIGLPELLDPPPFPRFGRNPVGPLLITNDDGDIRLQLKVSGSPAADLVLLGIAPCSAGIAYAWNFVTLGRLPAPVNGFCDITDLYVARFGRPRVGSRVFVRARQQINGWSDAPKQTTALVPAA
jgi:hypothetical protein